MYRPFENGYDLGIPGNPAQVLIFVQHLSYVTDDIVYICSSLKVS